MNIVSIAKLGFGAVAGFGVREVAKNAIAMIPVKGGIESKVLTKIGTYFIASMASTAAMEYSERVIDELVEGVDNVKEYLRERKQLKLKEEIASE